MTRTKLSQGELYCILSGFLYGLVGYFGINAIHSGLSIHTMSLWRFFISALSCFFVTLFWQKPASYPKKEYIYAFLNGAIFYTISTVGYFGSSLYIGTGLAMVVFFAYPAFVLILDYLFYRTTIQKTTCFSMLLIFIGMFFLGDIQNATFNATGIALGIFGALGYACYIIISKKGKLDPTLSTAFISLGCMSASFACALIDNSVAIPSSLLVWANLFGAGIICTALPILFLLKGLARISAEKAAILSVLEPIFTLFFGVILLDEQIFWTQYIGIIIILSGAIITLVYPCFIANKNKKSAH